MTLLIPLGLLGLLGVAALIIIYIIKPNYQQKFVSSTFVWKLSLKYKKRRFSANKLRNILLIICQVLILVSCAVILSQPALILQTQVDRGEVVLVIDASASMRAQTDDISRFERAVNSAYSLAEKTFDSNGIVSVVLAGKDNSFIVQRESSETKQSALEAISGLIDEDLTQCTYGSADIDSAMAFCEQVTDVNPDATVCVFTDNQYSSVPKGVEINLIRDPEEWNLAILNAKAELIDGFYQITVEMACYGRDEVVSLELEVNGTNAEDSTSGDGTQLVLTADKIDLVNDAVKKVIFKYQPTLDDVNTEDTMYRPLEGYDERIFSFKNMRFHVEADDNYSLDNDFYIYGGQKETLKIQYASSKPNTFFQNAVNVVTSAFKSKYNILPKYVKEGEDPELSGYDFYIFEHGMPANLPTDGVVFLVDPDNAPANSGFTVKGNYKFERTDIALTSVNDDDPLMNYLTASDITINSYQVLEKVDSSYKILMTCSADGNPLFMYRETNVGNIKQKLAVLSFSVHYSNIVTLPEFPLMLYNMFEYFFPVTVEKNAFEVFDDISLNARGEVLTVSGPDMADTDFTEFPAKISVSVPGVYTLRQTTFTGKEIAEQIYVKTPAEESNILAVRDTLANPFVSKSTSDYYGDLLFYFALALVVLLFAEWWLQSRDNM